MKENIQKMKEGNEDAFKTIYNAYWKKVFHFTQLYLTDPYQLEEVVQEVFIKLWEIKEHLDEEKSLEGLLFIITKNPNYQTCRRIISRH